MSGAFPATWGVDEKNSRFVSETKTRINGTNVHRLKLKWAYGLSTQGPRFYPLVTTDTIFVGDSGLGLVALDRETGCRRWVNTDLVDDIASSILFGNTSKGSTLFLTNRLKGVFAVSGVSGETIWISGTPSELLPMYSGSPLLVDGRLFVPISSREIGLSLNPFYGCCTTSGGMAALDSENGDQIWYLPTIEEEPKVIGSHFFFVEEWGPSGAPVWSAATYDRKRGLIYYGTGENYTEPATRTSDAIFAVDVKDGRPRWVKQFTANDTFNLACLTGLPNCPESQGPDLDFGAPPILASDLGGRELLFVGQKSGDVYAIDPDTQEVVWHQRLGRGGYLGGVHWGMAVDPGRGLLYVPISDYPEGDFEGAARPGIYALDLVDGSLRWGLTNDHDKPALERAGFWPGFSSGIVAAEGLVVAGDLAGVVSAFSADDGDLLWSFDTSKTFETINGLEAAGGSIDAHGPLLVDDLLIVVSGYEGVGMKGGNALLIFELSEGEPNRLGESAEKVVFLD